MTRRPLLITEHVFIKKTPWDKNSPVIGQIRRRQSKSGKVDFWQIRQTSGDWVGKYPDQETAEKEVRNNG